ncbi:MAG TPA: hypothetical protein VK826_07520 [Bacteroidia bacterium]|nr:hypothetical protein [Bacteroidia bacterium]
MRNATYTLYNGLEVELGSLDEYQYMLLHRGKNKPDNSFVLVSTSPDVFEKLVPKGQITTAFIVYTYASYKGHKWQVDRKENNKLRLSIGEPVDVPGLKMISQGWYEIWADASEVDKVWEEREPSGYPLPFPENLPKYMELSIDDL